MPKINVYLPDALADRVREARLPVSRICQAALTQALDGADRAAHDTVAELALPEPVELTPPPNHHVAAILRQAYDVAAARGSATVEPVDILQAFLDEGESLVLNAVELLGFPAASIQAAIDASIGRPPRRARPARGPGGASAATLSPDAHTALTVAAAQAGEHGSPATTGSHLLLGLIADDGTAGAALRAAGVTEVVTPAVLSALYYGAAFGRMTTDRDADTASLRIMMFDVLDRLDRLQHQIVAPRPPADTHERTGPL
ncbi:Clp protease N-terminal domain-containing protein [Micromonospora sp. CA-263727]|uniref:Clp protease N-terminal domain-containing protein n=1 Tax=Micromonospora sp. CA-263727 TaxID=3239967 RepID=UPI003D8F0E98